MTNLLPTYARVVVLNPILDNPADTGLSGYVMGTSVVHPAENPTDHLVLHLVALDGPPVDVDPGNEQYGCTTSILEVHPDNLIREEAFAGDDTGCMGFGGSLHETGYQP